MVGLITCTKIYTNIAKEILICKEIFFTFPRFENFRTENNVCFKDFFRYF